MHCCEYCGARCDCGGTRDDCYGCSDCVAGDDYLAEQEEWERGPFYCAGGCGATVDALNGYDTCPDCVRRI